MFLKECEGRELFERYGLPVARGVLVSAGDDVSAKLQGFCQQNPALKEFVVKAQLLSGKRGKHGGIWFAENLAKVTEKVVAMLGCEIHGETVAEVLVQEKLEIERELYLGVTIDRFLRKVVVVFSAEGGVDIEELSVQAPEKIVEVPFAPGVDMKKVFVEQGLSVVAGELESIAQKLYTLFCEMDAQLAEINPLILTPQGGLKAADAKVIIDDNAVGRHVEYLQYAERGLSTLELKAREAGLAYVELEGDVAIIGNGAGLVMATLDAVQVYGGKPANFCDVGGGASAEMMEKAMDIVLEKASVRGLFINIFGGITHCDDIATGILEYREQHEVTLPMVIRMEGTNGEKAREVLQNAGVAVYESFNEAAQKAGGLLNL